MSELCKLWVNNREIEADGDRKLIDVLRNDLRLKSVKDGCSEGACGTCTVVIDGKATKTCVQKVSRMAGKHVLTVEGLSQREKDVFVYAFGEAGAVQCGFCIPGMVMCGKALIDANPAPSRLEIAAAIRNNICRCTGYKKIIDAIAMAADLLRTDQPLPVRGGYRGVGDPCQRVNVKAKVLGVGRYTDDLDAVDLPGMCYGSAIRSAYPRAVVKAIHAEKAKALPGVVCVLTADDIPGSVKVGHLKTDWDTLIPVGSTTHFLGDAIALVAALNSPDIDLRAITTVSGNVDLCYTAPNSLNLARMLGFPVKVAKGAPQPILRDLHKIRLMDADEAGGLPTHGQTGMGTSASGRTAAGSTTGSAAR